MALALELEHVYQFWNLIEAKMGCSVPKHIQHILAFNGYENAVSIKTITSADINMLETYAQTNMQGRIPPNAELTHFYGNFVKSPDKFVFLPGYVRLIEEIVLYIKRKTSTDGPEFFAFKTKSNESKRTSKQGNGKNIGL